MVVGYILGQHQYYLSTIWLISGVYYEFHVGCKQTLKEPLSVFLLKLLSACYHWFWVYPQFATISLDLCMQSLHNLTMFYSYACQLLYTMELIM